MSRFILANGRILDPASGVDRMGSVVFKNGVITSLGDTPEHQDGDETVDCTGKIIAPGFIDLHVHLREPGQSAKETIETGTAAAAAGGFTTVVCMPNTTPAIDSTSTVAWIKERAAEKACVNVRVAGALSKGIAGEEMAPLGSMAKAGVVAFTDDGHCIQNHELMRRAVEYARMFDIAVMDHCQDYHLVGNGMMHEGHWSTVLGLPGWSAMGEELIVLRNILLAENLDHRIHCQHLSAAGSVQRLREAKARGVKISGELCPHHIALTDEALAGFDTLCKMNPPLRAEADVAALIEGVADGTIEILASDHAPHCGFEKEVEFSLAPFGILGLETEIGLFSTLLVHRHKAIDFAKLIEMYTAAPARLLKLDRGTLAVGAAGDATVLDPDLEWTYDLTQSPSRSRNSPFHGWELKGRAVRTVVGGRTVWAL